MLADFEDCCSAQEKVDVLYRRPADWIRSPIFNMAGMGAFSADRTIRGLASEIWGVQPLA